MTEYLLEPLRAACRDTDPYVRKTAAICIAKLHDIAPEEARASDERHSLLARVQESRLV